MSTIASCELRNHTAAVLDRVSRGETYTITVHGRPVAELRRASSQRRPSIPRAELVELLDRQRVDPTLADDMAWIADGTTDELDDLA